jgi:hypothetical protein
MRRVEITLAMKILIAALLVAVVSAMPAMARKAPTVDRADIYIQTLPLTVEKQRDQGFKPRKDVALWPLSLPLDWGADPYKEGNWRFQLNSWRMTDPLLAEYFRSRDAALLLEAWAFIEDWHRFHYVEKKEHKYSWYNMATGTRALGLAFYVDAVNAGLLHLTPEQNARLIEMADDHTRRLQSDEFIAINNHGLFQVAGLHLLCTMIVDRESCRGATDFAERKLEEILSASFTPEGVHTENSPSYHFFVRNLLHSLGALKRMPRSSLMDKIEAVGPWLVFPDGSVPGSETAAGKRGLR